MVFGYRLWTGGQKGNANSRGFGLCVSGQSSSSGPRAALQKECGAVKTPDTLKWEGSSKGVEGRVEGRGR